MVVFIHAPAVAVANANSAATAHARAVAKKHVAEHVEEAAKEAPTISKTIRKFWTTPVCPVDNVIDNSCYATQVTSRVGIVRI